MCCHFTAHLLDPQPELYGMVLCNMLSNNPADLVLQTHRAGGADWIRITVDNVANDLYSILPIECS